MKRGRSAAAPVPDRAEADAGGGDEGLGDDAKEGAVATGAISRPAGVDNAFWTAWNFPWRRSKPWFAWASSISAKRRSRNSYDRAAAYPY